MSFLAGVPGKLKTLQDNVTTLITNFTSTISGRIDVATSTRAPSSTALSTATWSGTRAAFLDQIPTIATLLDSPVVDSPISINAPTKDTLLLTTTLATCKSLTANGAFAPTGYSTALSLTGKGILNFLAVTLNATAGSDCGCRLTVDGVVLFNSTTVLGTAVGGINLVGAAVPDASGARLSSISFDQLPFNTSMLVEFYTTTGPQTMECYSRYRKSAN